MPVYDATPPAPSPRRAPVAKERRKPVLSLLEVAVLLVITGVIASAVTLRFAHASGESEQVAFCTQLRGHLGALENFYRDTGAYPPDAPPGDLPTGLEKYVDADRWTRTTPIGGSWDLQFKADGVTSAVGVEFGGLAGAPDDEVMAEIDATLDDGDLTTGAFRKFGPDRFYYVVLE